MPMRVGKFSYVAVCVLWFARMANAQSFDCAKASTNYEKLICGNRELSTADSQMAAAYQAALAQLSDDGKLWLIRSQRSWLRYDRNTTELDVEHLKWSYVFRIKRLQHTIETKGPFQLEWITMFKGVESEGTAESQGASSSEDDGDSLGAIDYTFPRIE